MNYTDTVLLVAQNFSREFASWTSFQVNNVSKFVFTEQSVTILAILLNRTVCSSIWVNQLS